MKSILLFAWAAAFLWAADATALDYTGLGAVKRLTAETRYAEAVSKLESMAAGARDDGDRAHYLQMAADIAADQLKNINRAQALIEKINDPGRRDFARLKLLTRLKKQDEALALVQGKDIEQWPVECRGTAYSLLGDICQTRKENATALQYYTQAVSSPATPTAERGSAARNAGTICLAQGDRAGAEKMFRQALAISPAHYAWRCESLVALSRLLISDRRAPEAVQLFESVNFDAMDIPYWKASLLEAYARALLADGKKIKAAETFDAILRVDISKDWKAKIEKELDKLADEM